MDNVFVLAMPCTLARIMASSCQKSRAVAAAAELEAKAVEEKEEEARLKP